MRGETNVKVNLRGVRLQSKLRALAVSSAIAAGAASVSAQQPTPEADEKARGAAGIMLEEVMVTAQKRAEGQDVQRIPLAVTAFTSEMLEVASVESVTDLGATAPNVYFAPNSFTPNVPDMSIRGQGTQSSIPSDDPAVGIFVDGVVLGMLNGANLDMFDVESAEVLRGPQGTLFGRNVTAGALLLRTKRASFVPSANAKLTVGSNGQLDAIFTGTAPLIGESLAGKVALFYQSTDGNFDNVNTIAPIFPVVLGRNVKLKKDLGESESFYVRPSLRWVPTPELTIDLIAEYGEVDGENGLGVKGIQNIAGNAGLPDFNNNKQVSHSNNGINELTTKSVTIDATYDTAKGQWAWVTGYRAVDAFNLVEVDGGALDIFQVALDPENEQWSQEIRWSGRPFSSEAIEATIGGYYFTQDVSYREGRHILASLRPTPLRQGLGGDIDHSTWAAFGRLSWGPSERWLLNAGLRYTSEEKSTRQSLGANCNPLDFAACNFGIRGSQDWSSVGGELSAQYFVSDDVQFYASYSRGFRSGGYNLRNAAATVDPAYDEEVVDSYEVGVKSDLFDRLRVNVALYRAVYDDLQRTVLLSDGSQRIENSGKATVDGLEIEANWLVSEVFAVGLSYGFLDGGYDELDPSALNGVNATRAASGLGALTTSQFDLARVPQSTAALSFTLDQPLNNSGVISYRLAGSYRDSFATNDANTLYAPSSIDLSANITYRPPSDRWSLSLWGKNILDETIVIAGSDISFFDVLSIMPGPRYGVDLRVNF